MGDNNRRDCIRRCCRFLHYRNTKTNNTKNDKKHGDEKSNKPTTWCSPYLLLSINGCLYSMKQIFICAAWFDILVE